MEILTESDITSDVALRLRENAKESQITFWARVGVTQSTGCRYESGAPIPKPVRMLMYAVYVAGMMIDSTTAESASKVKLLGSLQTSEDAQAKSYAAKAAMLHLDEACKLLNNL